MYFLTEKLFDKKKKTNIERLFTKGKILLFAGLGPIVLASCGVAEMSTNSHVAYDVIDTEDAELVEKGITQIKNVNEEDFKLVINYKSLLDNNEKWTITSRKKLCYSVRTEGLPEDYKVYVSHAHLDCSIISHYPSMDGIKQDTMDETNKTALTYGKLISDNNAYDNIFQIEGQDLDFIEGSFYGFKGHQNGEIVEKRYVESDFLEAGVTGNIIDAIFDITIIKPDGTVKSTAVGSTITISAWPYIELVDGTFRYYYWDDNANIVKKDIITKEVYSHKVNQESSGLKK